MHSLPPTRRSDLCLALALLLTTVSSHADDPPSTESFTAGTTRAEHRLEGTLSISAEGLDVIEHNRVPFYPAIEGDLPAISVELASDGEYVVPLNRGYRVTDHPAFDIFVSPGRAWRDGDTDVASLPFTLIARGVGCTHNGLFRFEYSPSGIDAAEVLVNQETCHFAKFDLWGDIDATFEPSSGATRDEAVARYRAERANRVPTRDFSALETLGVDTDMLLGGLPKDHQLTTAGAFYDGIHYSLGCRTRSGPYPYCEHMLMTSFSTAKTAFPPVVLMRLTEAQGRDVFAERVADYLYTSRSPGAWDDVTFDHLVDMTSGNFVDPSPLADPGPGNFYMDLDRAGKLAAALSWPNGASAGTQFVYQTGDTFALVAALDEYLARHGLGRDAFDYLVREVLQPIGTAPEVQHSRRTQDNGSINSGTAFGGMGMFWDADSIVKVARFLSVDAGRIGDRQVLDADQLAQTLQRHPTNHGIDMKFFGFWYNNGTWAYPATRLGVEYACDVWVPFMSGLSGVRVFMAPNDATFYYFNDVQAFPYLEQSRALEGFAPYCGADG